MAKPTDKKFKWIVSFDDETNIKQYETASDAKSNYNDCGRWQRDGSFGYVNHSDYGSVYVGRIADINQVEYDRMVNDSQ